MRRRAGAFLRRAVDVFRRRALGAFFAGERRRVVARGREAALRRLRALTDAGRAALRARETCVKTTARGRSNDVPVRVILWFFGL